MNEPEKSLELAKLMLWQKASWNNSGVVDSDAETEPYLFCSQELGPLMLNPYHPVDGLAQFAAILLKFPEVLYEPDSYGVLWGAHVEPTQANILDEILRMNGVEID